MSYICQNIESIRDEIVDNVCREVENSKLTGVFFFRAFADDNNDGIDWSAIGDVKASRRNKSNYQIEAHFTIHDFEDNEQDQFTCDVEVENGFTKTREIQ